MHRIPIAFVFLLLVSAPAYAQAAFEPTSAERATIAACIERSAGESELKQMSATTPSRSKPIGQKNKDADQAGRPIRVTEMKNAA